MPKTEDGGFILDDSGMCPYSVDDESEKDDEEEKKMVSIIRRKKPKEVWVSV